MTYFTNILFTDDLGRQHEMQCHRAPIECTNIGAVYAFVRFPSDLVGIPEPLYFGKATELNSRLGSHETWSKALGFGANAIAYMPVAYEHTRQIIEQALIRAYTPVLNKQHNALAGLLDAMMQPTRGGLNALAGTPPTNSLSADPLFRAMMGVGNT